MSDPQLAHPPEREPDEREPDEREPDGREPNGREPNGREPQAAMAARGDTAERSDIAAELRALLAHSAALPAFRDDVAAFLAYRDAPRVTLGRMAPRVKVARVLAQLLAAWPALRVARVHVDGESGCAHFRGTLSLECADGATHRVAFRWDCRWRAEREGWRDASGAPDQGLAAATFGWRCFAEWTPLPADAPPDGTAAGNA